MDSWKFRDELLKSLNQWYLVLAFILLGALIGFVISYVVPAPYQAVSDIYIGIDVERVNQLEYIIPLAEEEPLNLDDYKNWQLTQVAGILTSDSVFNKTLSELRQMTSESDELTLRDLRKAADIYWYDTGVWRLEVVLPQKEQAVEVISFAQMERNLTNDPPDLTEVTTIKKAIKQALDLADITINDLGTIELHDCFSIAGVLAVEALGFAEPGKGAGFIADGHTARDGKIPINTTGGLIGWGHPTGGTGVHQAVTIWEQLTGKAGEAQINISEERPYGMTINMGGDDVTVVAIVYKRGA